MGRYSSVRFTDGVNIRTLGEWKRWIRKEGFVADTIMRRSRVENIEVFNACVAGPPKKVVSLRRAGV